MNESKCKLTPLSAMLNNPFIADKEFTVGFFGNLQNSLVTGAGNYDKWIHNGFNCMAINQRVEGGWIKNWKMLECH